jgi:uncharacterized protein YceH (UPF0502 family)
VVGCLVEKQRTTPDHYPLTLNSLRLACNQSTNRDPVVDYDEATIRKALGELGRRRWIRSASGHTSRAPKYRQLIDVELNLPDDQISILAVLMLRGEQTPGERLHAFEDLAAVQRTLEDLIERDYVERLERRPGQKEERYRHLLGGGEGSEPAPAASSTEPPAVEAGGSGEASIEPGSSRSEPTRPEPSSELEQTVAELRAEVTGLRADVAELRTELAATRDRIGAD